MVPIALMSRERNMAAAQNAGTNSITKVLESICRERRREHLDKESEGTFNVWRMKSSNFQVEKQLLYVDLACQTVSICLQYAA